MSMVIWAELETEHRRALARGEEELDIDSLPDDLPQLHEALETLNARSLQLGQTALMEMVDFSDLEYNHSEEELPDDWLDQHAKWLEPQALRQVITALANDVAAQGGQTDLLQELHHVLARCGQAQAEESRIRLVVVM
ncbi:hypothetical protein V8J88_06125 [Massilia sp. W12]|uniref:hypothetical protein n=1 Tax=Massilia sp. W12 TaxID=3126507 RepID=UPI0030CA96C4